MEESGIRSMETSNYAFVREVPVPFEEAVERTKEVLKMEGFGVLSEIRMDEKFREKLGVDFRKYVILGACNPPLAYETIRQDINIGLLLPCNVVVYEADEKSNSVVAAINAGAMMAVAGSNEAIEATASEVNEKLQRMIAAL